MRAFILALIASGLLAGLTTQVVLGWPAVSVAAADCTEANIATTAALVRAEAAPAWLEGLDLPSRLVDSEGNVTVLAGWPAEGTPGA